VSSIQVRAPFDGALIGEAPITGPAEIERALETATRLYRDRSAWLGKGERVAILRRAALLIAEQRESLAHQVAQESGKPLKDARIEIDRAVDCAHIAVEELRTHAGHVVPMGLNATSAGRVAFTQFAPIGVVLGISAFNHPFNLVAHQVFPALAVGAPVVVKPSPKTPLSCRALLDILREAGLPEGWAQMVLPETNEAVAKLVADPRVAFLSFIGSANVGWRLRSLLAPGARVALEHGGVAPVIVARDVNFETAIPRIARAGFWHAGQACVSVQRVFCDAAVAGETAERIATVGRTLLTGDPILPSTDVGPLITHSEVDRVSAWVDEATGTGAKAISGAERLGPSCYANTVLLNPSHDAKISTQEVFGPVIAVYPVDGIDEAIAQANALPFAFQAAVFTRDLDIAMRCYDRLDATAVMVNESTLFRVDWMPFAGARLSGHGVGGIQHTMRELQTEKMMVWRSDALA
jgi:acyl-CoA reductase-like NAD-dependent aldehyde dehydrogenase